MRRLSETTRRSQVFFLSLATALGFWVKPATSECPPGRITIIDMVPYDRSGELYEDCEPSLAVDNANPFNLVGTAFTPDPMNPNNPDGLAPIFYSTDGGASWYLNSILPTNDPETWYGTNDVSVCFGGSSGNLYIAMIPAGAGIHMKVLVTEDFKASPNNPIIELFGRQSGDQPHVSAVTAWGGPSTGSDLVYVTSKDLDAAEGKTSTLDHSDDTPLTSTSKFYLLRLEEGENCNQDGPSVLSAPQLSGHVYASFLRWREGCPGSPSSDPARTTDLMVLRDDDWGVGDDVFTRLQSGTTRGIPAVIGLTDLSTSLDWQRVMSKLAIAASPVRHDNPALPDQDEWVYLAWGDGASREDYKLHLKRSTTAGSTWEPEIAAIPLATNPALAVNNQGVVGFLYQTLVGWDPSVVTSGKWETRFRTMNEDLTLRTDDILASVPNTAPRLSGPGPLGDYLQLVAVGKNFYGVFSAMNYPVCANFPKGVIFQRNVDWSAQKLLDLGDPPTEIDNSVDPFFFKYQTIPLESDFYVRDWTESSTNGDAGLEPSSHRNFYSTSDVWNRRIDLPGGFTDDQPPNETPGSGSGSEGDNWAFARIRRNALPASGSQTVNIHFLVSKFGTGSNFVDATSSDPDVTFPGPDPTLTFNASNQGPILTPAYPWHLNVSGSSHLCLAVEISTPTDPYVAPSLRGNSPGWSSGTDLRIAYDNNKAQRNMGVAYVAQSQAASDGSDAGSSFYALIHNAATFTRDVVIGYEVSPDVLEALPRATLEVVGGRRTSLQPGKPIVLKRMQPGENRWIGFDTGKPNLQKLLSESRQNPAPELPIYFYDMVGEVPANGFGISVQPVAAATLNTENVRFHKSTFARPALSRFPAARETRNMTGVVSGTEYLQFLRSFLDDWSKYGPGVLDSLKLGDPFQVRDAAKSLNRAVSSEDNQAAATLHGAFLNRLDSFVTMVDLSAGDLADVLQTVRWEKELFETRDYWAGTACQNSILAGAASFIRDYSRQIINESRYPDHIQAILPCLRQVAQDAPKHRKELQDACDRMQHNLDDPRALQRAHRDYLLELDRR